MTDEEKWKEELKEGKLTQEDFDFLMKSKEALGEMDESKNGGGSERG